jgi:hypothetical protein
MGNFDLILDKLRESKEFRLITAKDNILASAISNLCGSTTDIEDYLYVFDEMKNYDLLNEDFEKKLTALNDDLKNTEDFNFPLTLEIEELCQKIRLLGPSDDTQSSIWSEKIAFDELHLCETFSFEEIFRRLTNYIFDNEKDIFARIISCYSQNEKEKKRLIEQLEKELISIKSIAENLLTFEEIDNNWGSQLQEISRTQAYRSDFYRCFKKEKEAILLKNSIGLNDIEKSVLSDFFDELCYKLSHL